MDCSITDDYPADAANGCDFLSGAAKGEVVEDTPDGQIVRPEKIVVTSREVDWEGRICIGERTARHFAHLFGMVDAWKVDALIAESRAVRDELATTSAELGDARHTIRVLRESEIPSAEKVYLALDGTEHGNQRGAAEATARLLGVETRVVLDACTPAIPQPALETAT